MDVLNQALFERQLNNCYDVKRRRRNQLTPDPLLTYSDSLLQFCSYVRDKPPPQGVRNLSLETSQQSQSLPASANALDELPTIPEPSSTSSPQFFSSRQDSKLETISEVSMDSREKLSQNSPSCGGSVTCSSFAELPTASAKAAPPSDYSPPLSERLSESSAESLEPLYLRSNMSDQEGIKEGECLPTNNDSKSQWQQSTPSATFNDEVVSIVALFNKSLENSISTDSQPAEQPPEVPLDPPEVASTEFALAAAAAAAAVLCRRPSISDECLSELCDITELKKNTEEQELFEGYEANSSFVLGEGGREMLRACLNARGCKGRRLQGASVPVLLKLAHDWGLWNVALRIKVERLTGKLCSKHLSFVNFKAIQSHLRKLLKRKHMAIERDRTTGQITAITFEETKSLTLGKEGRERLRAKLRRLHEKDTDALLEKNGFKYSELRNATVPQLLKMAHVCCMWNDVVDACKRQEAKKDQKANKPKTES